MSTLREVKATTYYHDLHALYGDRLTHRVASSIARAHGTSLPSLLAEGHILKADVDPRDPERVVTVGTARLVQALGYGEV
jgi:hypothetical protein